VSDNLRAATSLAGQVYATQFIQAEAMRVAYQDFRRRWQRPGARAVGGALVWQLNDCWPVTSWALIDSAGTVKPAWHAIRRAMAPLAVALRQEKNSLRFTVMNAGATREVTLRFKTFDLQGNCRFEQTLGWTADNDVSADGWIALPVSDIIVVAEVIATDARTNSEISRDCAWPEPFKYQDFSLARVSFHRSDAGLKVSATAPVKGLWLRSEGLEFEDNFIDLVPGDVRHIAVRGARQGPVVWSALDQPGGEVPEALIPGAAFSP
jgi:beta-mannosidase